MRLLHRAGIGAATSVLMLASLAALPESAGAAAAPGGGPAAPATGSTADATATSASPSRVGASIDNKDDVVRLSRLMGRPLQSVRVYYSLPPAQWSKSWILSTIPSPGVAVVSFTAGTPTYIRTFLASRPHGITCYASYFHEPEDNLTSAAQKAKYRSNWQMYAPAIRAAGCHPTLILMKWTLAPASGRHWRDFYAPGTVDVLAFDAYNTKVKADDPDYMDPGTFLEPILAVSRATGLPWGLAEVGSAIVLSPSRRATWAHNVAALAVNHGARFVNWWDGPTTTFRLDRATAAGWHA
jgi:hypothetical protein